MESISPEILNGGDAAQVLAQEVSVIENQARTVEDIVSEAVNQPTEAELAKAERLAALSSLRITTSTEIEPEQCALSVDDVGIFALRDIHAIKGKQKSGKSSVMKVLMSALLCGGMFRIRRMIDEPVVLFLDTEQKAEDVKLVISKLKEMTECNDGYIDSHLFLYNLRRLSYDTLLQDTRLLIEKHRPKVVFIDGLVDYVASFNDEVLSRELIQELLKLCDEFNCAIVNALHENKSSDDENMRGHLGTVLGQKAANVLQCQKSKGGLITVSCPDSRHETMPAWSIRYDETGIIVDAEEWVRQEQEQKQKSRLEMNLERQRKVEEERVATIRRIIQNAGGCTSRKELKLRLMENLKVGESTAQRIIKDFLGIHINMVNGYIRLKDDADLFT